MKETSWCVPAPDGKMIHGIINPAARPGGDCVVLVHGLGGYPNEFQHKTAAMHFQACGYDVLRPALYGRKPGSRRLRESTLATHVADLACILAGPAAAYERVFLIGHSYGGPTIMLLPPEKIPENVRAVSLWDPSFDLPRVWDLLPAHEENGLYFDGHGVEFLINSAMLDEVEQYDAQTCLSYARGFRLPVQVIHAEDCIYNRPDEISWHSAGNPANERHLVPGADHNFCNGDTVEALLSLTGAWFARFGKNENRISQKAG